VVSKAWGIGGLISLSRSIGRNHLAFDDFAGRPWLRVLLHSCAYLPAEPAAILSTCNDSFDFHQVVRPPCNPAHLQARDHTFAHFFQEKPMRFTLLTCGLLMATSALADSGTSGGAKRLQALDIDGDQLISLAEAQAGAPELASRFSKIDANQDGLLSIDEVLAGRPTRDVRIFRDMQTEFAAADDNADGMLTRTEAEEMPIVSDFFGEMDGNADGHVTQDEIREHGRKHGPIRVMKGLGPGIAKE
jgi:hypothetical protein